MPGRRLGDREIADTWQAWTPGEIAARLSTVTAPWCVTAGWALELFTDAAAREHEDLEIAVPAARFHEIAAALSGFAWDVAGDGQVWPHPHEADRHFQTWLRDASTGRYHLDVFREPHTADRWVCRRDPSITLAYDELILHTDDGIPYAAPEVALLFKAKHLRAKDRSDFHAVLPALNAARQVRLRGWLSRIHPGHPWLDHLMQQSL